MGTAWLGGATTSGAEGWEGTPNGSVDGGADGAADDGKVWATGAPSVTVPRSAKPLATQIAASARPPMARSRFRRDFAFPGRRIGPGVCGYGSLPWPVNGCRGVSVFAGTGCPGVVWGGTPRSAGACPCDAIEGCGAEAGSPARAASASTSARASGLWAGSRLSADRTSGSSGNGTPSRSALPSSTLAMTAFRLPEPNGERPVAANATVAAHA
ncbi:hypothetical protein GCM10009780_43720 [Actinomadura alba]